MYFCANLYVKHCLQTHTWHLKGLKGKIIDYESCHRSRAESNFTKTVVEASVIAVTWALRSAD